MKIEKKTGLSILFSFFVFMSLNLPTIKFIYSSELMNILALAGIIGVGMFRWMYNSESLINLTRRQFRFLLYFMILWHLIFTITWIQNPTYFTFTHALQYISVILFSISVLLFLKLKDVPYIVFFQVTWGTGFAFLEWTMGVPRSRELGQTYLTAGVVIAATIVVVMGLILSKAVKVYMKVLLIPVMVILLLGITSLSGRAPILLSLIVPVTVYLFSIFFEKSVGKKVSAFIVLTIGIIAIGVSLYQILPANTINRMMRVFVDIQSEPRYQVYEQAFIVVRENPFGIGLRGYRAFNTGYPHNIFLEIAMSGGIVALVPFMGILTSVYASAVDVVKSKNINMVWLNLSMYFFLTWNISFDLSSSYMVFISMVMLIKCQEIHQYAEISEQNSRFFSEVGFGFINKHITE
ncbi:Oligosaccharide repeat unit polymerase Wzy [Alkalibacterium sp. AK22]|uniref:O-antigen ligase family protein n=1 Tax=Alkalibacterium sp. AK22 TaxID=1229520 RepID=UPI00044A0A9C|nr:O-antigen ligase family protein [Alkalibacterium sp. AK22]EXJ23301.1 Oligosaccharide repeat unit polymerase Wzy [Alkalibacterium sp. AK22]